MKTVWKYPITRAPRFELLMPQDAKILCLQVQDGTPCIWAEGYSEDEEELRQFCTVGTGHAVPPAVTYVGTWQDGPYVWHVYERAR